MDQHQINVIGFQLLQGFVNGCLRFFVAGVGHPDLCSEEQFLSGDITFLDGVAYCLLVSIGLGCINGAVTYRNGILYTALTFFISNLGKLRTPASGILTPLFNVTYSIIYDFLSVDS